MSRDELSLRDVDGGVSLSVRVKPRAARDGIVGSQDGALVVRVTAPPAEGQANAALVRVVAEALDVPRSRVEVLRGHAARVKQLRIAGLSAGDVRARLATARG